MQKLRARSGNLLVEIIIFVPDRRQLIHNFDFGAKVQMKINNTTSDNSK